MKPLDMTGQRYGRLMALRLQPERGLQNKTLWLCRCDCGCDAVVDTQSLRNGSTRSCGCLQRETRHFRGSATNMAKVRTKIAKRSIAAVSGHSGTIDTDWDDA
tara:strand:- start:553 stop:861 length:309 start_codon:yes stop_codon:yes gene_type:complete